jgi:hypothetical protein
MEKYSILKERNPFTHICRGKKVLHNFSYLHNSRVKFEKIMELNEKSKIQKTPPSLSIF